MVWHSRIWFINIIQHSMTTQAPLSVQVYPLWYAGCSFPVYYGAIQHQPIWPLEHKLVFARLTIISIFGASLSWDSFVFGHCWWLFAGFAIESQLLFGDVWRYIETGHSTCVCIQVHFVEHTRFCTSFQWNCCASETTIGSNAGNFTLTSSAHRIVAHNSFEFCLGTFGDSMETW